MQNGYVRNKNPSIGVMSPYAGQVVVIRDKIGNRYDKLDGFIVKVKIVDVYEGGEEDDVLRILVSSSFHKHVNLLAEAFEKIDNTVIASFGADCSSLLCSDAIFIDMKAEHCRKGTMRKLFRKLSAVQAAAQG